MNLSLFGEPAPRPRSHLAETLTRLADEQVFIGTSSWKYEGWLDQIYARERYVVRGQFSRKRFAATCLAEYAETFPVVCGDFSFYQFPSPDYWSRLFHLAPEPLRFAFKVPEEVTVRVWPAHERYGPRAGQVNDAYLNAGVFRAGFFDPLEPHAHRVAALIFEFAAFPKNSNAASDFVAALDRFLGALPAGMRYSVEVRNPEFLDRPYFDCLRRHGAAHVFNAWTRMPELSSQIQIPDAFSADFVVARALLRHGRTYEQAVERFSPYSQATDPNPAGRDALRSLIERGRMKRQPTFLFVNNRFEGNAPKTIEAIVES